MASRSLEGSSSTRSGSRIDGCRHPYVTGPGTESLAYQRTIGDENGTGAGSVRACMRYRRKRKNPAAIHTSLAAAPRAINASQFSVRDCYFDNAAPEANVIAAEVPASTVAEGACAGGAFHGWIAGSSSNTTSSPCHIRKRAFEFVSAWAARAAAAVNRNTCSVQGINVASHLINLVLRRRFFGVVDHHKIERALFRLQFQPELFLHRDHEIGRHVDPGVGARRRSSWLRPWRQSSAHQPSDRRKIQIEVVLAGQPGLVHHPAPELAIQHVRQL